MEYIKNVTDIQQFQELDNLELIARHVVEGFLIGLHRSPFHGFSVEFAEHRLYNTGESTKHIDWKLYARTEKLFVKKYEEETNLRSHILIDTSSSMLFPFRNNKIQSKLAFSVYCASALIYLLGRQRDAAGLTLFSEEIEMKTESRLSNVHIQMIYAELAKLLNAIPKITKPDPKTTNTSACLHQIAERIPKRSLVVIFSDMLDSASPDELFSALQHLRHKKHEVILFHVIDRKYEENFRYHNRPYKFIDMESGEEMKLNPNDIRDNYVKGIKNYFNELKLKCGQYSIDIVEADINSDFKDVLMSYLIKRKALF